MKKHLITILVTGFISFNALAQIHVTGSGDVGIGTTTPVTKLDVIGEISATGGISTDWNTAFGWGNHALVGYLTFYTESDPIYSGSVASGITISDYINWTNAYNWGDHALAGYLSTFTELDPVFGASPSAGILAANITNWNMAFSWGDHAAIGYVTTSGAQTLTNKTIIDPRIQTAINDANGNEVIEIVSTFSAVNEMQISNASTGNNPYIAASGANSNIGIDIVPKGTGNIYLGGNVGIGTTTPFQKLHVVGTTRISTLAGTGNRMVIADVNGDLNTTGIPVGDITGVTAGAGLSGGGTSGTVTLMANAINGLNVDAGNDAIQLGGTLSENTTISIPSIYQMTYNLTGTGDFNIQDNGTTKFQVKNNGVTYFGDDTYWNDGNITGTPIASLTDQGDDGRLRIYENGIASVDLNAGIQFVFNEPGSDRNFRVEGNNSPNMFFIDAGLNRIGIGTNSPGGQFELSLDQGIKPATNTWTIVSDERLKDIMGTYEKGLTEILLLEPIKYQYKNDGDKTFDEQVLATENVGFSAQEVKKIFPECVGMDDDGYLNFNIHAILVAQVNAIKELNQRILKLEETILEKDQEINSKEDIIHRLEAIEAKIYKHLN